ncbi:MAG TPA: hypothetical protein GXZ89_08330 [Fastidiosipila sp.]|jgi:predicted nucleotidyltransferase|nr:hypothetical protein [Fastidiosipila sp.]
MSFDITNAFNKSNLDTYLKELAKLFRKQNGKGATAEIVLVGGAAILVNYGFRDMTTDIDALIYAPSSMKDAINQIGEQYHLPRGWLNADFMRTASYTNKLNEFSQYYKTFSGVLQVRSISAEYLIAMKLKSGRKYKNDLSDIVGILAEHDKRGKPITLDRIELAVEHLYQGWDGFSADAIAFIQNVIKAGNYMELMEQLEEQEKRSKDAIIGFQQKYPNTVTESNVDAILEQLQSKNPKNTESR